MKMFGAKTVLGLGFLVLGCSGVSSLGGDDGEGGEQGDSGGSAGSHAGKGGSSGTGNGGSSTGGAGAGATGMGGGAGYEPCAGRVCGSPCTTCPPDSMDCVETTDDKYCDATGICTSGLTMCANSCESAMDCPAIGAPCVLCPDGTMACPGTACENGQCVNHLPYCPAACMSAADCPALMLPCQMCADGSSACPTTDCVNGQCITNYGGCGATDPCDGRECGERCNPGAPNDMEPGEDPAAVLYCDHRGTCGPQMPMCPEPQCASDMDCPWLDICLRCADSNCGGAPKCTNGTCSFTCPDPERTCRTVADCDATSLCSMCSGRSCGVGCSDGVCSAVCDDLSD